MFKPPLHITFDKAADEFNAGKYEKILQASTVSPPRISLKQGVAGEGNSRMEFLYGPALFGARVVTGNGQDF